MRVLPLAAQAYHARTAAGRGELGVEDVLLAISAREAFSFVQPPSQEVILQLLTQGSATS